MELEAYGHDKISIHALREEGDIPEYYWRKLEAISIHALREEGDRRRCRETTDQRYFYPRPPRGGRQLRSATLSSRSVFLSTPSARRATYQNTTGANWKLFLSTPSARRATGGGAGRQPTKDISIHALREEGDSYALLLCLRAPYFYPRPPRGGRRSSRWC